MRHGDPQGLAYAAGAGTEQAHIVQPAPRPHGIHSRQRFERADQDTGAVSVRTADEIEAPVDSIGTVDVGAAGWAEHHFIAPGRPPEAVRGRILVIVCLGFHDPSADAIQKKRGAYEGPGYVGGRGRKIDRG